MNSERTQTLKSVAQGRQKNKRCRGASWRQCRARTRESKSRRIWNDTHEKLIETMFKVKIQDGEHLGSEKRENIPAERSTTKSTKWWAPKRRGGYWWLSKGSRQKPTWSSQLTGEEFGNVIIGKFLRVLAWGKKRIGAQANTEVRWKGLLSLRVKEWQHVCMLRITQKKVKN